MQRLEVSGAVRPTYGSLGVKRLIFKFLDSNLEVSVCTYQTKSGKGNVCNTLILSIQSSLRAKAVLCTSQQTSCRTFLLYSATGQCNNEAVCWTLPSRTPVYTVTQWAMSVSLSLSVSLTLALYKFRLIALVRMAIHNQSCMCRLKI